MARERNAHGTARCPGSRPPRPLGANLEGDGPRAWLPGLVGLSQKAQSAQKAQCRAASGQARLCKRIKPNPTQNRVAMSPLPSRNGPTLVARCLDRLNGQVDEPEFFLVTYHLPGTAGPSRALERRREGEKRMRQDIPVDAVHGDVQAHPTITLYQAAGLRHGSEKYTVGACRYIPGTNTPIRMCLDREPQAHHRWICDWGGSVPARFLLCRLDADAAGDLFERALTRSAQYPHSAKHVGSHGVCRPDSEYRIQKTGSESWEPAACV